MNRKTWLDTATAEIRFSLDRKRVRRELDGHLEDAMYAARARGLTAAEAEAQALAAMGDPKAIAPELGRLHSPWLGQVWRAIRILTASALVILLFSIANSAFRRNLVGWNPDPLEVPPEVQESNGMTFTRTGLWENLDLGEAGGYHFTVATAWAQTQSAPGENGYETTSMALRLTASTQRVWASWQPDQGCMSVTDSTGCTYFSSSDPRSMEPFAPYFSVSGGHDGPGGAYATLYLGHMPTTPEWLDVTIGDAVLRIDLEGGGAG